MAVTANVVINIEGKNAASVLAEIKRKVEEMNGAFDKVPNAAEKVKGLGSQIAGFATGLVSAAAAAEVLRRSVSASFERSQAETRLKALTSAYGETAEATELAAAASNKFGLTQTDATKAVADVYGRLRPLGFSLKEISGVYDGFNVLTKQAGISSAETSSIFTQLSQALGSGTLRGDEFNRMAESMPAILGLVAKELGVNQNALRGMAEKGQITADVVVKALKSVAGSAKDLDKFLDPSAKAMNELAKNSEEAQVQLGNLLKPAAVAILQSISKALEFTAKNIKQIVQVSAFFTTFAVVIWGIQKATDAWAKAQKAAAVATAFLQALISPAGIAKTAIALGVAAGATVALGAAMGDGAKEAAKIDPATQRAAKAATMAAESSRKFKEELEKTKARATELAIEMQDKVARAARAATAAVEQQSIRKGQIGSIVAAQIDSEIKLNELYKFGLERQLGLAKTAQQRLNIVVAIARNEIKAAQLVYQQALANLRIENEKLKLQQQAAITKSYEIAAEGRLQILKAKTAGEAREKTIQLNDALRAQNQAIQATAAEVAAQQILNGYMAKTAESQYRMAVATTTNALEQRLLGEGIGLSARQASLLAGSLDAGAISSSTMNGLAMQLENRMSAAAIQLNAGTQAAVQNAAQYQTVATNGIQSTDEWRESVLRNAQAQQQVAVVAEKATTQIVASNNIRVKSAIQTDKQIEDSAQFAAKKVTQTWSQETKSWDTVIFGPLKKAWANLVSFFPQALKNALALVSSTFASLVNNTRSIIRGLLQTIANSINSVGSAINRLISSFNRLPGSPDIPLVPTISVPSFAEGGMVTKPTLAMVGDGGEPEYMVPKSKAPAFAQNWLNATQSSGQSDIQVNITTGPVLVQDGQEWVTIKDLNEAVRKTAETIYASLRTPAGRYATGVR